METPPRDLAALFRPLPVPVEIPAAGSSPRWWQAFGPARLLLATALTPFLLGVYADQVGGWASLDGLWRAALLFVAVPAALTMATYLPQRSAEAGGSPCASIAGLTVLFAGMALGGVPPQPATLLVASGIATWGLAQRLRGSAACATRWGA